VAIGLKNGNGLVWLAVPLRDATVGNHVIENESTSADRVDVRHLVTSIASLSLHCLF